MNNKPGVYQGASNTTRRGVLVFDHINKDVYTADDGRILIGKPTLRQLLRYWWRNRK
jgi:hypothetical protein